MGVKLDTHLITESSESDDFLTFLNEGERTEQTVDVVATIPNGDFKHLSEKIIAALAWWESTRVASKAFRERFDLNNSLFFIVCSELVIGFFYPTGWTFSYQYGEKFQEIVYQSYYRSMNRYLDIPEVLRQDPTRRRKLLVLPRTWCCIDPISNGEAFGYDKNGNPKHIQGLKNMPKISITVLEQRESHKRVESWKKDIRINPKSGRWLRDY